MALTIMGYDVVEHAASAEFKTRAFQSTFGFSDASAFSARSAVKLEEMVISLEKSTVPLKLY